MTAINYDWTSLPIHKDGTMMQLVRREDSSYQAVFQRLSAWLTSQKPLRNADEMMSYMATAATGGTSE